MEKGKCSCCANDISTDVVIGEYVCYCNHVTEEDIKDAILKGAKTIQEVIKATGAMKDSNCAVNNPKGTCCYSDIVFVLNKYKNK